MIATNPSRNMIRTFAIACLAALAIALAPACKQDPPKPGQEAFETANDKIGVYESALGFGNTPDAEKLASGFAKLIVTREAESFSGGKDAEDSVTTQGKWLTYCHVRDDAVVFLVHVPNLDTYEGETRKELAVLAFETAADVSSALRKGRDRTVVVGLRGNLLYGVKAEGKAGAAPSVVMGEAIEVEPFYAYFRAPGM